MIKYWLMNLDEQIDKGFGVTAEAFLNSAKFLDQSGEYRDNFQVQIDMPILYLYRHSIELFLKSLILIFHIELQLPYGEKNIVDDYRLDKFEIYVPKEKKWVQLTKIHDVKLLYHELLRVITDQKKKLKDKAPGATWEIDPNNNKWIEIIDQYDRTSQYFRYPVTKDRNKDKKKYSVRKMNKKDFQNFFTKRGQMALLLKNRNGEIVQGYIHNGSDLDKVYRSVRELSKTLTVFHFMTRHELLNGW